MQLDSNIAIEPDRQKLGSSAEDRHALGIKFFDNGCFPEAMTALEEALDATDSAPAEWWNDWSAAAYACGEMKKAEEGFRRALALNPEGSQPAANLGMLLAQLGRAMEAIPFLDRGVAGLSEPQRSAIAATLDACRIRAAADALAASQAAYHAFFAQPPEPPPVEEPESKEPQATEYWLPDITGWFSCDEALHLYTAVKLLRPRRILEIGTFFGRSTATICMAMQSMKTTARFVTIDLDFRSEEQMQKAFAEIHGTEEAAMPGECREAFELGLSTTDYARQNLGKHGLAELVSFESGDFRGLPGTFDFVFADVLHEGNEIRRNLADILAKIEPGGIPVAHDLSDENRMLIDSLAPDVEFISRCGTLGIYRIGGA